MHIAVVVPAFNIESYLRAALRSVVHQTHKDWSLVVVDDGSTDATAEVAAGFPDPRIRLVRQVKTGVSGARNRGIAAFSGTLSPLDAPTSRYSADWIQGSVRPSVTFGKAASPDTDDRTKRSQGLGVRVPDAFMFLDGDDWLAPDAVAQLADTLDSAPSAVAACGRYARVNATGVKSLARRPKNGDLLEPLLTRNLFVNGGQLLIRREAIETIGDWRCDLTYGEDWEYWTRLALLGEFKAVSSPLPLLFVRERPGSAYRSNAADPAAYRPAMDVIHCNPAIADRVGRSRLAYLRQRAEAETAWSVGRELIRQGHPEDGQRWLGQSVRRAPSLKRLALIGLSWHRSGPFRPYGTA